MQQNIADKTRELKAEGLNWDRVRQRLMESGVQEESAAESIATVKKEIRLKNRSIGMILIMIGSALCFFSMVYTYFFGHNYFMLYGLTMLGVTVAFAGLVYVMGM